MAARLVNADWFERYFRARVLGHSGFWLFPMDGATEEQRSLVIAAADDACARTGLRRYPWVPASVLAIADPRRSTSTHPGL
jgi:hypothetical protein